MNNADILLALTPIVEVLEELGVPYHVGGSVASSVYGFPRLTLDVDIVANLRPEHARLLVRRLEKDFYINEDAVKDAVRRRGSFNAIHFDSGIKVDVFIPKTRLFDQEELQRTQMQVISGSDHLFAFASPEDTILNKLEWYRMGGEVSDRQWNDVLGILKIQGTALDMDYLRRWAAALKVADLLEQALEDAGLQ